MSEIVTFFRNFEQDRGRTYRLIVQLPGIAYSILIYSRLFPEKSEFFSDQEFKDTELYRAYKAKLIESIGQSGGGLVVEVRDSSERRDIAICGVTAAEGEAYRLPTHVFYLEPGHRLAKQPFDGTECALHLPKDSHLILPVDEDAEKHFRSFRENYSSWFPADFEPIMLNLLRQPTLDLRVARLEKKLAAKSLEEKPEEKPVPVTKVSNNVQISRQDKQPPPRKKWVSTDTILPVLAALILTSILTAGIYGYRSLKSDIDHLEKNTNKLLTFLKLPEKTPMTAQPAPAQDSSKLSQEQKIQEPSARGPAMEPNQSTESLPNTINELLLFLSKQQDSNPVINKLWNTHFNNIQSVGNLDQSTVLELFKRKDFLWGMIKLPAIMILITNKNIKDMRFLESVDTITTTGDVYNLILDPKHQNSIKSNNEIMTMLAYLTCQVQETESDPKLKTAIKNNFFKQSTNIFKAEPCTNLKLDNALPGIIELKNELEKILPVSTQVQQK